MNDKLTVINVTKGTAIKSEGFGGFEAQPEHKLGKAFEFDGWRYITVTSEQAKSYERVRDQQGFERHLDTYYSHLMGCLIVEFNDPQILIGIEEDGYAHS